MTPRSLTRGELEYFGMTVCFKFGFGSPPVEEWHEVPRWSLTQARNYPRYFYIIPKKYQIIKDHPRLRRPLHRRGTWYGAILI